MVASQSDVTEIFRESKTCQSKIPRVLVLQVLLLALSPFSLLILLHNLAAGRLLPKFEDGYERRSLNEEEVKDLAVLELFLLPFCMVSLLEMMVTVYESALTYTGNSVSFMDLMLRIKSSWRKPLTTWLYVSCLTIIYLFLVLLIIRLTALFASAHVSYVWSGSLAVLATLFYLILAASWVLGLVVSVLESDFTAANALVRARKLLWGQKLEGFFIMLIMQLLSVPIYILFYIALADDDDGLGSVTQFAFGFVAILLFCLVNFFTFVVFTLLYFECKQSCGEKIEIEMELGAGYSLVCQELQVDPSLP